MEEIKKEIFKILLEFAEEYPKQRFTQILSNLNINESLSGNFMKENFYDTDEIVLERIKQKLKELENK